MDILITGHSGYIGSSLLPKIPSDYNILLLQDTKMNGIPVSAISKQKIDICIHLAGDYKSNDKSILYNSNIELTKRLLEELKKTNCKKIIFMSSIAVEKSRNSYYGFLKRKSEQILSNSTIPVTIIRSGPVYDQESKGVFLNFLKFNRVLIIPLGIKVFPTKLENVISLILSELNLDIKDRVKFINLYEPAQDYEQFLSRIYNKKKYIRLKLQRNMIRLLANIMPIYNIRGSLKRILND